MVSQSPIIDLSSLNKLLREVEPDWCLLELAEQISAYDPATWLYTLRVSVSKHLWQTRLNHLETGRICSLTDSLLDSPLWLASECTVDLPELSQGLWWVCDHSYVNLDMPSQHIFKGRAHEPGRSRDYSLRLTSDTVAHALNLTAETELKLELQVDLATLGITKHGALPLILTNFWMDQRAQGHLVPWIISPCLPRPQRPGHRTSSTLSPVTPRGYSLWQVVMKIHSFDFQTDRYKVDMSTGTTSLTRWGSQSLDKLTGILCRAQAIYIPT
eukprot:292594-Rhodomonas_salina.9